MQLIEGDITGIKYNYFGDCPPVKKFRFTGCPMSSSPWKKTKYDKKNSRFTIQKYAKEWFSYLRENESHKQRDDVAVEVALSIKVS
ncbi:MAG: hypothetical protein MJE68_31460 [Proteobacteria bacterium]|nr:hypothetical protein [Pseudomonadota bacterium]